MTRLVDLTRTYFHGMPGVSLEDSHSVAKQGWNAKKLHIYSHAGTHLDAPFHFGVEGPFVDAISPTKFIGKAWLLNLDGIAPKEVIGVKHLGELTTALLEGDSLVIKTGWSKHFENEELYRNSLPRIGEDLATFLADHKIKMLAVEPPSVADVNNLEEVTKIHKILLTAQIVIIEGLVNLDELQSEVFTLIALPLKIENGDGSPARVLALENKGEPIV
jgi:kynurenine formamidase